MTALASILDQAGSELGGFLPRLGGALVLLVAGVVGGWLLSRLVTRLLNRAGLDSLVDRVGTGRVLAKAGLGSSLTRLLAAAVRVAVVAVAIFAALSLLGLQFLSESLNQAVLLLPKLAVAGALLLAGAVAGAMVGERLDRFGREMDLALPIGRVAQVTVFAVFAITAAAQVAISTALLMVLVGILLAGATATVALAFGLGGQHVAGQLSAGRYVRDIYRQGQEISFDSLRGTVLRVESATVVLRTVEGDAVRVPNQALLSARVTLHDEPGPA